MKKIIFSIIIVLIPCVCTSDILICGYGGITPYYYPVYSQAHSYWCVFASISSHPYLDIHADQCEIATKYQNDFLYRKNVDCCNLEDKTNENICVDNFKGVSDIAHIVALANAYGIRYGTIFNELSFITYYIEHNKGLDYFPIIMCYVSKYTSQKHVCLLCGFEVEYERDYIKSITFILADPTYGAVRRACYTNNELQSAQIQIIG